MKKLSISIICLFTLFSFGFAESGQALLIRKDAGYYWIFPLKSSYYLTFITTDIQHIKDSNAIILQNNVLSSGFGQTDKYLKTNSKNITEKEILKNHSKSEYDIMVQQYSKFDLKIEESVFKTDSTKKRIYLMTTFSFSLYGKFFMYAITATTIVKEGIVNFSISPVKLETKEASEKIITDIMEKFKEYDQTLTAEQIIFYTQKELQD